MFELSPNVHVMPTIAVFGFLNKAALNLKFNVGEKKAKKNCIEN